MNTSNILRVSDFGDRRISSKKGAIVSFSPSKVCTALTKAFLAVNAPPQKRVHGFKGGMKASKQTPATAALNATDSNESNCEGGGTTGGGGGGGGGSGDDGNGDGDSDGPRRKKKSAKFDSSKSQSHLSSGRSYRPNPISDQAHQRALTTLILLTLLILVAAVALAITGNKILASEAIGILAVFARTLVKPK